MEDSRRINVLAITTIILVFCFFTVSAHGFQDESLLKKHSFFSGTSQEVMVYTITGETQGPTLLIVGGIHGDEPVCSRVAESYCRLKLKKGNLIIVPRLNKPALKARKRKGLGGDMNRLFGSPGPSEKNPDLKVVNLVKSLVKDADYVVNLHMGGGFYSPTWISNKRNPKRWGQSNVIDAPYFDLPNGDKLDLEVLAGNVARRANAKIRDKSYHFLVNNTDTAAENSIHKEQRKSLTYYALTTQHKMSLGLEVTKNCSPSQAQKFLTTALNSVLDEAGVVPYAFPSEDTPSRRKATKKTGEKTIKPATKHFPDVTTK